MIDTPIKTIDVHELKKRYDTTLDLCLIDVREQDEWDAQHIPRAIHIPKDEVAAIVPTQIQNKTQPIYLHCKGGVRSLYAAEHLIKLGYSNVYSINGGIMDWIQAGYPIE